MSNLFILGAHKCGTTTMMGILNCLPEVFILHAILREYPDISNKDKAFIKEFPKTYDIFYNSGDLINKYAKIRKYFADNGHVYKYFGSKVPFIELSKLKLFKKEKSIYMIRDLKTWLAKPSINTIYKIRNSSKVLSKVILDYLSCFVYSFTFEDCLHVKMEDLIYNKKEVLFNLGNFLQLEFNDGSENWWEQIGKWQDSDPKSYEKWWNKHPTSMRDTFNQDIEATIHPNNLWEDVLPIFYRYYNNEYFKNDISLDLQNIENLRLKAYKEKFDDMYESVKNNNI